MAAIQTFNSLNKPSLKPRRFQKLNNSLTWHAIKHIITTLDHNVTLHKVESHFNNIHNDQADALAKDGSESSTITEILPKGITSQLCNLSWNFL
jgi:ribonuclease HI